MERVVPPIHGPDHAPGGPDPIPFGNAVYAIEVRENDILLTTGDDLFNWEVPEDLDEALLVKVEGYVNGASSSGDVQVQIHNVDEGDDLLSDVITIEAGDLNSKDAGTQPVVDPLVAEVHWGDHLRIDVDDAGSGTLGLGVILYFAPASTAGVVIRGAQGTPGGVDAWRGDWDGGNTYVTNESVVNNGTSYVARVDNPTTEPGVDAGWEDEWQALSTRQEFTALSVFDDNLGREIDIGNKGLVHFPFPATIVGWTLIADVPGSIVLDVRKGDFGSWAGYATLSSITAGNEPELAAADKAQDSTLTGWTTTIAEDDILGFVCTSADTLTIFSLTLKLRRT